MDDTDVKVPAAYGPDGTRYLPAQIDHPTDGPIIADLQQKGLLLDFFLDRVEKVAGHLREDKFVGPYFRYPANLGGALEKRPADPTHNEVVKKLFEFLEHFGSDMHVFVPDAVRKKNRNQE